MDATRLECLKSIAKAYVYYYHLLPEYIPADYVRFQDYLFAIVFPGI